MKKLILVLVIALLWSFSQTALVAKESTVIRIKGKAYYRLTEKGEWKSLKKGDKVAQGAWVRASKKSSIRLIRSNGSFMRVRSGKTIQIGAAKSKVKKSGGSNRFFGALNEMFSGEKRARMAASRGAGDNSNPEATRKKLAAVYDSQWIGLMRKPKLEKDDIDLVFDTAGYYQERPRQNRAAALLIKLKQDNKADEGFAQLADQAVQALGQPGKFTVMKKVKGKVSAARQGDTLYEGDGIGINFKSETESYLYVFLRTVPAKGSAETARIYPPMEGAGWALPPEKLVELPLKDEYFILDANKGEEYLFGWSCTAPIFDPAIEAAAMTQVSRSIDSKKKVALNQVKSSAPGLCTQAYAFSFKHR